MKYVPPINHSSLVDYEIWFFRLATDISPDLFVYRYRIDQLKVVKYLVKKYPGWLKSYSLFANHFEAMDVVAEELSSRCNLTLHALPLWVGGHHIDYGVVFFDDSMTPEKRTPQDTENLEKLEGLLESTEISYTPKANFEKLCSAACRKYPVEPVGMASRPAPLDATERDLGYEILIFVKGLREEHRDRKRKEGGVSQEKGSSDQQGTDTRPVPTKKRKRRATPTPEGEEAGPRWVLSGRARLQ